MVSHKVLINEVHKLLNIVIIILNEIPPIIPLDMIGVVHSHYWGVSILYCRWEHLVYQFGCHSDIIKYVITAGRVVHSNGEQNN